MSRLYAVESLFTLTGANADHRLRVPPSMIVPVLARLAMNILRLVRHRTRNCRNWPRRRRPTTVGSSPCAKDLKANPGKSLVMAGYRLPLAAHLLVIAMNEALGAVNHTVEFHQGRRLPRKERFPAWPARSMPGRSKRSSSSAEIPPTMRRLI